MPYGGGLPVNHVYAPTNHPAKPRIPIPMWINHRPAVPAPSAFVRSVVTSTVTFSIPWTLFFSDETSASMCVCRMTRSSMRR